MQVEVLYNCVYQYMGGQCQYVNDMLIFIEIGVGMVYFICFLVDQSVLFVMNVFIEVVYVGEYG